MALATYSDLQTSVASWLRRTDLTTAIPDFIALAEAQINRRLRVRQMVTRAEATLTDEYSAVPDDFAGVKTFSLDGSPPTELQYLSQDQLQQKASLYVADGVSRYYTVVGGEFRFFPAPSSSQTGELTYYAKIPALSDSNMSNWLLETSPDIYLYGALMQSAPYLRADPRVQTWSALYLTALSDLQDTDAKDAMGAVLTPIPGCQAV